MVKKQSQTHFAGAQRLFGNLAISNVLSKPGDANDCSRFVTECASEVGNPANLSAASDDSKFHRKVVAFVNHSLQGRFDTFSIF